MPDITMCTGVHPKTLLVCPKKNTCYRHVATPCEFWQSYFTAAPFVPGKGFACEFYWKLNTINNEER